MPTAKLQKIRHALLSTNFNTILSYSPSGSVIEVVTCTPSIGGERLNLKKFFWQLPLVQKNWEKSIAEYSSYDSSVNNASE